MWPRPSLPDAFIQRRRRLMARLDRPALIVSGFARPRNFANNVYPFRAESHFLYLVGQAIEGAALVLEADTATLYAVPPDPEEELWTGPMSTLEELASSAGVTTRPIDEIRVPAGTVTLPAQDWEGAFFQSELLGREVSAGDGDELEPEAIALAEALIELRLEHDDAAIDQLRQAAQATEAAHRAGLAATRPGLREAAVRAAMEAAFVAWGYQSAYSPIVTRNGEVLHATRQDQELCSGDLLLADVGAETPEGWAGDVTRTWPVSGRFSPTQREIYGAVLAAQRAAIELVRPGVRYRDIHRAAGRALVDALVALGIFRGDPAELFELGAAALFFPHGVGHLLGLDVHDMEDLGDRAGYAPGRRRSTSAGDRYLRLDRDLRERMAVTIEPGFYRIPRILEHKEEVGPLEAHLNRSMLAKFSDVRGIRIEDDVLVGADGPEILSGAIPKEVAELEEAMR
ncbi:MAG TPA: aminopeptidase P family protein [Polyangiaceae bacterium]